MSAKESARSWVVLSAVTFTVFLEVGIIKGFSVLLPELTEQLVTKTWIIGTYLAIFSGGGFIFGLSAGVIVKKFGPRCPFMICGLISSAGLIVCACATSAEILLIGLLLSGCFLLQVNIAIGMVPDYFARYFDTAVNVYLFGTGVSVMVMPLITQVLLDTYGWRGALIVLSGFSLHSLPCGALLKRRQSPQEIRVQENTPFLMGSVKTPTEAGTGESDDNDMKDESLDLQQTFGNTVGSSLLTHVPFIARVLVPGFVWGYTFTGWMIYIISFAQYNGASTRQSSIVATCGGIGLAAVRIVMPFVNKLRTYKQILYVSSFVMVLSLVLTTLWTSLVGMNISSLIFGIGVGMLGTETHIAVKDTVAEDEYINAISWFHLVYGFASILSGSVTGLIFDTTESFTFSFAVLSSVSILTAVALGLEDILEKIKNKKGSELS